jgi:hypothetical protein
MPPRTWEPIFDGVVGAARRVGKCVPDKGGVESPGQGGHRHTIPPACGIDDGGGKFSTTPKCRR